MNIRLQLAYILQISALSIYLHIGLTYFEFPRRSHQIVFLVTYALLFDVLVSKLVRGRWKMPMSGTVTALAIFILVQSISLKAYIIALTIALGSKHLFRLEDRHVFNPANIGVICALTFFRSDVAVIASQWTVDFYHIAIAIVLGGTACTLAGRAPVGLAYIGTFLLLGLVRTVAFDGHILFYIGPLITMSGVIFQFHMITDPRTTPDNYKGQIIFGASVACLDVVLRTLQVLHAPFLALAIISSLQPLFFSKFYKIGTSSHAARV